MHHTPYTINCSIYASLNDTVEIQDYASARGVMLGEKAKAAAATIAAARAADSGGGGSADGGAGSSGGADSSADGSAGSSADGSAGSSATGTAENDFFTKYFEVLDRIGYRALMTGPKVLIQYCAHTLYSLCTVLIHCTHCTHTLYSYCCTHTLYAYTVLTVLIHYCTLLSY
jgi:hypothetical protein